VDPGDGSCWVSSGLEVFHLARGGSILSQTDGFESAGGVWVDPQDGSCWVSDWTERDTVQDPRFGRLVHLARDGTRLEELGGFGWRGTVLSGGESTGAVWAADSGNGQLVLLYRWFDDVDSSHWALQAILACYQAGIVGGYGDGLYHPEREVSRGQMSVFVARGLAGGDEGVPDFIDTPTFPDVDAEHWALDYVEYVVSQNIVEGYEDGTYHPEYQVTRGQMAIYVARAMVAPTTSVLADYTPAEPRNFPDVTTDHWAYTYVEYCVEQGIVGGFLDGTYRPDTVVTRDQMAVYVARAFELAM
jgi:hypothetical protein